MLSLNMDGGSRRRRRGTHGKHGKKHSGTKGKKRGVVRRTLRGTKKMLKRARKINRSLLKLISPKRMYN